MKTATKEQPTMTPLELPELTPMQKVRLVRRWLVAQKRMVLDGENMAENANGESTAWDADDVCRVCLLGAVNRAGLDDRVCDAACCKLGFDYGDVTDRNTGKRLTHAQIKRFVDEVERLVKKGEYA